MVAISPVIPPPPESPPFPPPQPAGSSSPGRFRGVVIATVLVVIVVIGIIGYAVAGFAYASEQAANADRTLNSVVSHQNSLNSTFKDIDTKFNSLNNGSTFDPQGALALMGQFVANATAAGATVEHDDASLVSARATLDDRPWLTVLSRGALDQEAERIDHARKALGDAKTVATGYVADGQFFEAFIKATADLDPLGAQSADLAGAAGTLATMKTDVDRALELSTAPGLPTELHDLMVDFQTLVTDFGNLVSAAVGGNNAATTAAEAKLAADANKISAYDFTKIGAEIDSYYKPLVDGFNSEMAQATA